MWVTPKLAMHGFRFFLQAVCGTTNNRTRWTSRFVGEIGIGVALTTTKNVVRRFLGPSLIPIDDLIDKVPTDSPH